MKRQVGLIIFVLLVGALFMAENALAQIKCKTVEVHMSGYWEYEGIEACGVEGYCGDAKLVGTLNGELFVSGLFSDHIYPYGDSIVWRGQAIIEMMQGEIFTTTTGVNFYGTYFAGGVVTNVEAHAVTGGSGRYEGATGYLLMTYEFSPPEWFPGTGEISGQVCWPGG
jgi:hypothetical protein